MHPADLGPSSLPLPPPFPFPSLLSSFFYLLFSSLLLSSLYLFPLRCRCCCCSCCCRRYRVTPPLPSSPSFPRSSALRALSFSFSFASSSSSSSFPSSFSASFALLFLLFFFFLSFLPVASSVRAYTGIYRGQVSVYKVTCPALASDSNYYQRPRHHRG